MSEPLVSILIFSYNFEKYIQQAIESCLMQETNFPYEIIIHDDASTDKSALIIREFADRYPDVIVPILQKENQYSKGVMIEQTLLIPKARGKYIALCEGDDYWTDPTKLSKQIDYLENHPEYSGSAHQSLVTTNEGQRLFKKNVKSDIYFNDLLGSRIFHTASFVFRSDLYRKYPPTPVVLSGDRLLFLIIAACGPIYFINDVMCVYRKHENGMSSTVTYDMLTRDFNAVDYLQKNIEHFPKYRYLSFIHNTCMQYPQEILPFSKIIKHYFLAVFYSFSYFPKNFRAMASTSRGLFRIIWKRVKGQTNLLYF